MTTRASFTESEIAFTAGRVALASGILGSVGATLGWLGWLVVKVGNKELAVAVLFGALLGIAVHWLQHYVHVARRERRGEGAHEAPAGGPRSRTWVALSWATGFAFLGLLSEDLVAHIAAQYLVPFLASLATLLPAGIIIGWTMSRGRRGESNALITLASGVAVGATIALVTGLLWSIGFGEVPWGPLFAWWVFVGLAMRVIARDEPLSLRLADPLLGVGAVFVATFLINFLPTSPAPYEKLGPFSNLAMTFRAMANEIQHSPDVPATFWIEAEAKYEHEHPDLRPPAPPKPAVVPRAPESKPVDVKAAVERLTGPPDEEPNPLVPADAAEKSAFYRSWTVMLLFALGVGIAPAVERALRPADYPNSETYRRDLLLAGAVVVVLIGSCVWARHERSVEAEKIRGASRGAVTMGR